jgi:hypothetical protein
MFEKPLTRSETLCASILDVESAIIEQKQIERKVGFTLQRGVVKHRERTLSLKPISSTTHTARNCDHFIAFLSESTNDMDPEETVGYPAKITCSHL